MYPTYHAIISSVAFGFLYLLGFPLNFVLLAFFASILVDIDHLVLGRIFGTYNPIKVYNHCATREIEDTFTPREMLLRRWFDMRVLPFHNLFINAVLLIFFFPVGIGVLLHNILDGADYVVLHIMGWDFGCKRA